MVRGYPRADFWKSYAQRFLGQNAALCVLELAVPLKHILG